MEMQRCYNVSNLRNTLISTQRKKARRGTGTEGWRGGVGSNGKLLMTGRILRTLEENTAEK